MNDNNSTHDAPIVAVLLDEHLAAAMTSPLPLDLAEPPLDDVSGDEEYEEELARRAPAIRARAQQAATRAAAHVWAQAAAEVRDLYPAPRPDSSPVGS